MAKEKGKNQQLNNNWTIQDGHMMHIILQKLTFVVALQWIFPLPYRE